MREDWGEGDQVRKSLNTFDCATEICVECDVDRKLKTTSSIDIEEHQLLLAIPQWV